MREDAAALTAAAALSAATERLGVTGENGASEVRAAVRTVDAPQFAPPFLSFAFPFFAFSFSSPSGDAAPRAVAAAGVRSETVSV